MKLLSRKVVTSLTSLLLVGALSACAGGGRGGGRGGDAARYSGLSCAPFARELTGLQLTGDAAAWWEEADGRYPRVHAPQVGSALVFARSGRLPSGHVSVVSRLDGPRQIAVIQANWVPGRLARDEIVVDVSAAGDWTLVRVWYSPVHQLGIHAYVTYGFVLPTRPRGHDALAALAEPAAVRVLARD